LRRAVGVFIVLGVSINAKNLSKRLLKRWLQTRLKALSQRIEAAEQAGLQEDVDSLTLEFSDLSKKLSEYLS